MSPHCPECNRVRMAHCSDPAHCGGMVVCGWQPIETAPTDKEVLGFQATPGDHENRMAVCWPLVSKTSVFWCAPNGLMPTHWMPLPEPPK